MASKPASSSSAATQPPQQVFYPLDTTLMHRDVYILKVPDVLADIVRRYGSSGFPIGTFKSAAPVSGIKRSRNAAQLVLDTDNLKEALGEDAAKQVPTVYNLSMNSTAETPDTRIISEATSGFAMFGTATKTGQLAPDLTHPSYTAFSQARRAKEKSVAANRLTTELAPDGTIMGLTTNTEKSTADYTVPSTGPSRIAAAGLVGAVKSIFALFERSAYWSIKEFSEATGRKESELRPELQECCDYIKSGPNRGKHRLKPEYRTLRSVPPDENDGITDS